MKLAIASCFSFCGRDADLFELAWVPKVIKDLPLHPLRLPPPSLNAHEPPQSTLISTARSLFRSSNVWGGSHPGKSRDSFEETDVRFTGIEPPSPV